MTVDEDKDVFIAQSVQTQEGTHGVGSHRGLGHHAGQRTVECCDALFLDFLTAENTDGCGCAFQTLVVT